MTWPLSKHCSITLFLAKLATTRFTRCNYLKYFEIYTAAVCRTCLQASIRKLDDWCPGNVSVRWWKDIPTMISYNIWKKIEQRQRLHVIGSRCALIIFNPVLAACMSLDHSLEDVSCTYFHTPTKVLPSVPLAGPRTMQVCGGMIQTQDVTGWLLGSCFISRFEACPSPKKILVIPSPNRPRRQTSTVRWPAFQHASRHRQWPDICIL